MNKSFEELKATDRLPSPPGIVMELLRLTRGADCSAHDIARVVQPDPALTGRILHMANSAGAGGQAVTTVAEAAVRLGMNSISAIALGFSLVSGSRHGRCEAFSYDRFWARSLARAVVFQLLARRLRCGDPSELFVCGLVSSIGQLALVTVHPLRYSELLKSHDGHELLAAEQQAFGIDHHEVTSCLLREWGLPDRFLLAVEGCWKQPDPKAARPGVETLTSLAAPIADAILDPSLRPDPERAEADLARFQRWDPGTLVSLIDESVRDWHHWGTLMEIPTQPIAGPTASAAVPASTPPSQGIRVLAVDDDPTSLKVLEVHLKGAGYQTLTATNGREALRTAVDQDPHLVVADWRMPDMDGVELCRALRTYNAGEQTYVILVTSEAKEERILEAFEAGVDDYVLKPYRPKLLLARVRAGCRVIELKQRIERDKVTMEAQVAELGILTRSLEVASLTDPLTALPNRRHGLATLDQLWRSSQRDGRPLATLMIDIDHFKRFNDEHGHDVGDAVLRSIASTLQSVTRSSDLLFRFGGEEFCVLLGGSGLEDGRVCAERLRAAVESATIQADSFTGSATVSIGIAERTLAMERAEDLIKAADEALYVAKESGRNRACAAASPVRS